MLKQLTLPLVISAIALVAAFACDSPNNPSDTADSDDIDPRYLALGELPTASEPPELAPLAPDSFLLFIEDEPMVATFIRDEVRSRRVLEEALRQPLLPAPHPALTGARTKASR